MLNGLMAERYTISCGAMDHIIATGPMQVIHILHMTTGLIMGRAGLIAFLM